MRYLLIPLFILLLGFNSVKSADAIECLPSCNVLDSKFLEIAGTDLSTIAGAEIVVNLVSRSGDNLQFGIFDGEAAGVWDVFGGPAIEIHLKLELHADPQGDGSGLNNTPIALWTTDGSSGLNAGSAMSDNEWSDFTFANVQQAQGADGSFIYTIRITPIDPMLGGMTANVFKIRTQDIMYVPAMFPVTYISNLTGVTNEQFEIAIQAVYPNVTLDFNTGSFCGFPPGEICDLNDPSCCFFETNYDGVFRFFMNVPEGEEALDVWDGDYDYGDLAGTVSDTDDPNTPGDPFLPEWSLGTDVVFQTARPALPHDNNGSSSEFFIVRDPNITYFVIDPLGNSYQNFNPSGDREWELFKLSTLTDDPAVAEYMVDSIPPGLWEVRMEGVDISNLNSIVLPFDLRGVEDDGTPTDDPTDVPTLNEWGLAALSAFVLLISVYYIRRQRRVGADIKRL
ncbi:MAG: IPTL-CTERM sorting domain-containing protein [Thermodesulfobacteriota bacterium]